MAKKKVLLINTYFRQELSDIHKDVAAAHSPPMGIGYVGTYLNNKTDCDVEIIDPVPQCLSVDEILEKVKSADYVGLPCYTDLRFQCFDFAKKVKEVNPDCMLIVGGPHVYHLDVLMLKHYPYIDVLVRGEGEQTALELVQGKPFEEIDGITYLKDGEIKRNPDRAFLEDIDDMYIDFSLLPDISNYGGDIEAPIDLKGLKTAYLIESRGCTFKCSYCANDHWKRTWRATSAKVIVDKMENLVRDHGIEYFRFYDDLFTLNRKRVMEFCDEIKKRNLKINFRVLIRAGTDVSILKALKEVGCESVGFGVESGSDTVLKRINKGITRQQVIDTTLACKEVGLWVVGSFIVSLPGETEEDYKQTLSLTPLMDTFMTNIQMLFPYTPFYNELKANGEIDDEIWFDRATPNRIFYTKERFKSAHFSKKELEWMIIYPMYYSYIHNPRTLFKKFGLLGGVLRYIKAVLDIPLKGKLDTLYQGFQK
jgi:anaerobic magnesium-protoporphyrin IX monomethyl ester cyclase